MLKYKILILIIFSCFYSFSQQDSTRYLSLNDALSLALENNYEVRIAKADVKIAENNNTWAATGIIPNVTVGVAQGNRYDDVESQYQYNLGERMQTITNSLTPNANLQMVLFNGFKIQATKSILEKTEEMKKVSEAQTVEDIVSEVINNYYSVLLEEEKLSVTADLMKLSRDRYKYVIERQKLGVAVTYDVLQVKNAFLQDSSNYLIQKMLFQNAKRNLSTTLADTTFIDFVLTDSLKAEEYSYILGELENKMLTDNVIMKNINISQEILEYNIKSARSSLYPSMVLSAGTDYSQRWIKYIESDYYDTWSYDIYGNLSLSYTVFNGGLRKRQIENAKIEAEKGFFRIEDLKLTLKSSLYSLYEMYEIRKQVLHVTEENLNATKLNLEISKDKFNRGAINSFNYRDVQMMYLNAAFSKIQAEYNLIMTHTDLMKITGSLVNNNSN